MIDALWFRQAFAPPLALLAMIYDFVVRVRASLYKWGIAPSESCGAFVVSLGNIQAGGTGKTPMVEYLASRWRSRTRLGIVSRGYGRSTRGSQRVLDGASRNAFDGASRNAMLFGDEPTLLAERLGSGVPIQVGERRVDAARDLIATEGVPLILLDDGFQHMALRRSFDFVLIDLSAPAWHFRALPWGRLREPMGALNRADAILFTKTESVSEEKIKSFETRIRRIVDVPMIRFKQSISWESKSVGEKFVAVAGVARPDDFFRLLQTHTNQPEIMARVAFKDHHDYSSQDVEKILDAVRTSGASKVLTTEKDAVKLRALWRTTEAAAGVELVVSRLEVLPVREFDKEQMELVDEIILGQLPRPKRQDSDAPSR